jgi:chloramphenicol 3-O phosphotransferase
VLLAAMYESIAAHSRAGLNVVVDIGHHDSNTPGLTAQCARRLEGLPVLFVGVRCPIGVIMERRNERAPGGEHPYVVGTPEDPVPAPVQRWQDDVHAHGGYDLEVDTSQLSPQECAEAIRRRLRDGPPGTAFHKLAQIAGG